MKLLRIPFIAILLLVFGGGVKSQEPPNAILVEEVGITCSEDLMARYDYFLGKLRSQPSAKGLLLFYGDRTSEGRNLNLWRFLTRFYPQVRQFDRLGLQFVRGANIEETKIQFWIVPPGADSPTPNAPFQPTRITTTTRYDVVAADFHSHKGKTYLYFDGFYELGCDFGPNKVGFVDQLRKDKSLIGYLVIYTEPGKDQQYGERVAKFAVNDLLKNFRIPRTSIRTIYGGNRKNPEIEFWLVPSGDKLPIRQIEKEPASK